MRDSWAISSKRDIIKGTERNTLKSGPLKINVDGTLGARTALLKNTAMIRNGVIRFYSQEG